MRKTARGSTDSTARAVSAGLMAVTSRSWPDEILHLTRKREREKHDASERQK